MNPRRRRAYTGTLPMVQPTGSGASESARLGYPAMLAASILKPGPMVEERLMRLM